MPTTYLDALSLSGDLSVTGAFNGASNVLTGTYTLTCTAETNINSITGEASFYTRVLNNVHFVMVFSAAATTGGAKCVATLSVPIASNFTNVRDATAAGGELNSRFLAMGLANVATGSIYLSWTPPNTSTYRIGITGMYRIR